MLKKLAFIIMICSCGTIHTSEDRQFENLYGQIWTQSFSIDKMLFEDHSDFQNISIFHNKIFGKVLVIDGVIQTTENDEFTYHEMMTHVPLLTHAHPKRVLVIGGGDGGIIREVLKHPNVQSVTLVELDSIVIDICKKHMPFLPNGAFNHPKVNVVIADGCEFVKSKKNRFDVIIVDSTDPIGPGKVLFTSEFYRDCMMALKEDGILACQNGCPFLQKEEFVSSHQKRLESFTNSTYYLAPVPTYIGGFMAFGIATKSKTLCLPDQDSLRKRIDLLVGDLKYYNEEIHGAAFVLPNYIQQMLD